MRIGIVTTMEPGEAEFLAKNGFRSAELLAFPGNPFDPMKTTDRQIDELRGQLRQRNITLSAVGYYPNHLDPAMQATVREHFVAVMGLAKKLGVGVVSTFAGREPEKSIDENMPAFKAYWSAMAKRAEDTGLRVAFENCPMFHCHPFRGINIAFTPRAWDMMFDAVPSAALGLEWDPSHLICLLIDPLPTIRKFASKIFHVHAKDAEVCWDVVRTNGILHEGAVRHRMPGLGQVDWRAVISALIEAGYRGDINIEGRHDPVYGGELERAGLLVAKRTLEMYVPGE